MDRTSGRPDPKTTNPMIAAMIHRGQMIPAYSVMIEPPRAGRG